MIRKLKSALFRSRWLTVLIELSAVPLLVVASFIARFAKRSIDVGLGPEPLINNVYHKRALLRAGYTAETFVNGVYYITDEFDFDVQKTKLIARLPGGVRPVYLYLRAVFRYRSLMIYMNGGPLGFTRTLRNLEPWLLKKARVRVIALAYGSDVQDLSLSRNLHFKHTMSQDYPVQAKQRHRPAENIERWLDADAIISGVEWVDYQWHWTHLMLGHFSIDTDQWTPSEVDTDAQSALRILHAPNHRAIKGTAAFIDAVDTVKAEGHAIELVLLERVPNDEIKSAMQGVDLVADQFVVGWYAMFALEAMALGKPVLCYLRPDLVDLYEKAGLITHDEIPLIDTPVDQIAERLRWACTHRQALIDAGKRGRQFVLDHHSLVKIGSEFEAVLRGTGVEPRRAA